MRAGSESFGEVYVFVGFYYFVRESLDGPIARVDIGILSLDDVHKFVKAYI